MNASSVLRDYSVRLRAQLTPRVMAGLAALAGLLAFIMFLALEEDVTAKRQLAEQLERELRLQQAIATETGWPERAQEARGNLAILEEQFWHGRTAGIVAARLQGEISEIAMAAGLERVRVEVRPDPQPLGTSALHFEISLTAQDRNGQFLAFMARLAETDSLVIPVRFEWQRANGTVRMSFLAPARLLAEDEAS